MAEQGVPDGMLEAAVAWLEEYDGEPLSRTEKFRIGRVLDIMLEWQARHGTGPVATAAPGPFDAMLDAACASAPEGVDRIDIFSASGSVLASRGIHWVPAAIEASIRGQTLSRIQADRIIELVNRCVKPEGE